MSMAVCVAAVFSSYDDGAGRGVRTAADAGFPYPQVRWVLSVGA